MIIANPIYDAVFKRLLENDRAAKFLIGTILNCKVLSLEPAVREHTKFETDGRLTLYRKDFSATIETKEEGAKRVIIEMQKAKNLSDIYRFREYLGGEYTTSKLPIIAIYILGFNLSVDAPAFAACPEFVDLRTMEKLEVHDNFVEHLTHKSYFVQTCRVKKNLNTRLDTLLSIFAQEDFLYKDETLKNFQTDGVCGEPEVKEILDILQYVAADNETRRELDEEQYYLRYVESTFGDKNRELEKKNKLLTEKDITIEEKSKELEEKDIKLEEKDKKLEEKDKELALARQRNAETARELKKLNAMPQEKIAELTGMTVEEIKKL